MHFETPIGGSFDERAELYRCLLGEVDGEGDDGEGAGPTDYACLGCGGVTTADERPGSCPSCHRTLADRRPGALFQPLG
jgi:rubrerythrin